VCAPVAAPGGGRRRRRLAHPACLPGGIDGWWVVFGGGWWRREPRLPGRPVVALAGWADQLADGIVLPPCGGGFGPVVSLPQRGRIRENCPAARHVAPGGGQTELVADDSMPGDLHWGHQRVTVHRGTGWADGPGARSPPGSYLSGPARHRRPPAMPGPRP
jgi:hypothetical protein